MNRVMHFDLIVADVERAKKFYESVFGWEITKWDGPQDYWFIKTGKEGEPGIDGGMAVEPDNIRSSHTITVADIDACLASIEANGGTVTDPKMTIPGVGYLAYCEDTEGIFFGVMQFDEQAA